MTPQEIRNRLKSRNISKIADASGLHKNTIYRFMKGESKPSYETIMLLSSCIAKEDSDLRGFHRPAQGIDCFLYVIECGDLYKVGFSKDPLRRFATAQSFVPFEIRPVAFAKFRFPYAAQQAEAALISYLKERGVHISGEWFSAVHEDCIDMAVLENNGKRVSLSRKSSPSRKTRFQEKKRSSASVVTREAALDD